MHDDIENRSIVSWCFLTEFLQLKVPKTCWHKETWAFFQLFFKDASDHHSSLSLIYQHIMNYRTVQIDFQLSSFNFYPIWTTWFHMLWVLLCLYQKAYILKTAWTLHIQHELSDCRYDIVYIWYNDTFLTRCMIKIFRGGQGWWHIQNSLPPSNYFFLYPPSVLRCFWKDPLRPPTTPLQASFTATPLLIHHSFPPKKNFWSYTTVWHTSQKMSAIWVTF